MASLSRSLYDMPGLNSHMDVLFLGQRSFLNKLLEQGYAKERLKSSSKKMYGRYEDPIKQNEVPHS